MTSAANDVFPRGWYKTSVSAVGGALSLVIPAIAGVAHVIDAITFKMMNASGVSGNNQNLLLSSSDGAFTNFVIGQVFCEGATGAVDEIAPDLGGIAVSPGASITFTGNAVTGYLFVLTVRGHDV